MEEIIVVEQLEKVYLNKFTKRKNIAVNKISFKVNKGEIYSLVGGNGSGKTSTIKMILGLLVPTSGKIKVLGYPASDFRKNFKIGYLPEESYYYEYLTVFEHLDFFASLFPFSSGKEKKARIEELAELTGITKYLNSYVAELSRGNLQRMGIAQSLLNDPELLIYDEPASGIDPVGRYEIRKILVDLNKKGKTIFFSSHFLPEVEEISTHIGIIDNGELLYDGKLQEFAPKGKLEEKFIELIKQKRKEAE